VLFFFFGFVGVEMSGEQLWDEILRNFLNDISSTIPDVLAGRPIPQYEIRNYVEKQEREMAAETFAKFMKEVHRHLFRLINSTMAQDKIAAILAINNLIEIDFDDTRGRHTTVQFANYLRSVLTAPDSSVLLLASKTLGRLVKKDSTLTVEFVEFEVKRALEWLEGDRYDSSRRHAAVLVLKEMAINSPTLFYLHVSVFLDLIWVALRDKHPTIRECGAEALSATLRLVEDRDHRSRLQWYGQLWQEVQAGFRAGTLEGIHASLLTIGELIEHARDYMNDKQIEVCNVVLRYRENRERVIKNTVVSLFPSLATYAPKVFVANHLNLCINHLFQLRKKDNTRAFTALGRLAVAVGYDIEPHLFSIVQQIKNALTLSHARGIGVGRRATPTGNPAAITCVSMLAKAVGPGLSPHLDELLPLMMNEGLTATLTEALADLGATVPVWLPAIQQRLLDQICMVLAGKPYVPSGSPAVVMNVTGGVPLEEVTQEKILLALKTLGDFNFQGHYLMTLLYEVVVTYLGHDNSTIRTEAVLTCAKIMTRPARDSASKMAATHRNKATSLKLEVKLEVKPVDTSDMDGEKINADEKERILESMCNFNVVVCISFLIFLSL
jgi:serine/threonine-protein kinase mTOR